MKRPLNRSHPAFATAGSSSSGSTVFSLPLFFLLRDRVGESTAWIIAIVSSLASVAVLAWLYVRYICNELSKSHFTLTDECLIVAGIRSSKCVEQAFDYQDIQAIVYGEPLTGME